MRELWILVWWWMLMFFSPWLNSYAAFGWSFIRELYSFMSGQSSQDDGQTASLTYGKRFLCAPIPACNIFPWEMRNYFQWRKKKKEEHLTSAHLATHNHMSKGRLTAQDNCLLGFFHFITFMLPYFFTTKPCQNHSYKSEDRVILFEPWNR